MASCKWPVSARATPSSRKTGAAFGNSRPKASRDRESLQRPSRTPLGGPQDEPGGRIRGVEAQDLPRLLRGEVRIRPKEPLRMGDCRIDRSQGL